MSEKKHIHDENGIVIPPEIAEVGFDFPRDIHKIWTVAEELPAEELPISQLAWHLDLPFFWQKDQPFSLKPREVINNPQQYEYRYGRIMGVDLNYPIVVIWWKDRWEILDGLHRLCKAVLTGQQSVQVKKMPKDWVPRIMPD